jgi:hypothetical protein
MGTSVYTKEKLLLHIARHLIVNTSFISDIGLYHGKMGIVLFFAHYSCYSQKSVYNDFASKLLNEVYAEISTETPVNFKNGLCGIGWAIEYLFQNGFLEGDTNEILTDIDKKIMEYNPLRMQDLSFEMGVGGMLYYILIRLTSPKRGNIIPFDKKYMAYWYKSLQHKHIDSNHLLIKWKNNEDVKINTKEFLTNII